LLDNQDWVLLVRRHRFVQDRWGWELPGGYVDEGEEPRAAAARELEDQTGYQAGQLEHLVTFQPMPEMADAERVVFAGRDGCQIGDPVSSEDAGQVKWTPVDSVPGLIGLFEVSRDRVACRLPDVIALQGCSVVGGCRGCRRSGHGGAGSPGCGRNMPGGLPASRSGSGFRIWRS